MLAITITVAVDSGSSGCRAVYTGEKFKLEFAFTLAEIAKVTPASITKHSETSLSSSFTSDNPFLSSWIEYSGGVYAIGYLAKYFKASPQLERRKFELTIPKALAMIGAISQKHKIPNGADINLALLLPWAEYADRFLFQTILKDALGEFKFCGVEKSFHLKTFVCLPEGAGVLFQGREPGTNFQDLDLAVLMLGFRDASLLFLNKGVFRGMTEGLGFSNLVKSVAEKTSLRDLQKLTEIICKAGERVNPNALKPLLQNVDIAYRKYEQDRIRDAILEAKAQYWLTMSEWLKGQITGSEDEIIIAGGTARYLKSELNTLLSPLITGKLQWCEELEKRIRTTFPAQIKANSLEYRLADVYSLFFYLYNRIKNQGQGND
jgi:hypothetical protein